MCPLRSEAWPAEAMRRGRVGTDEVLTCGPGRRPVGPLDPG